MSRSQFFFKCLNATIPLKFTLANEYPSSNGISKKNGTVQGDSIACDALFYLFLYLYITKITINNGTSHLKSPKNQKEEPPWDASNNITRCCYSKSAVAFNSFTPILRVTFGALF